MLVSYRKQSLNLLSWRVLLLLLASNSDFLYFSAHFGSNRLPEAWVTVTLASNKGSLCFLAHFGSNLLPEAGVMSDLGIQS